MHYAFLGRPLLSRRALPLPPWTRHVPERLCRVVEIDTISEAVSEDGDGAFMDASRRAFGWRLTFGPLGYHCDISADGLEIRLPASSALDRRRADHLLLNCILPHAAALQGLRPLHAAAVEVDRGAVVFVGASGAGKSTLAAGLRAVGARVLTDDCLALEPSGQGFRVVPSYPSLRLWPASCLGLGLDARAASAASACSSKVSLDHLAGPWRHGAQRPRLRAVFLLGSPGSHDKVTADTVRPTEAFRALLEAAFRIDSSAGTAVAAEFEFLCRVISAVPVYRLSYPWDYAAAPLVWEALQACLELRRRVGTSRVGAASTAINGSGRVSIPIAAEAAPTESPGAASYALPASTSIGR